MELYQTTVIQIRKAFAGKFGPSTIEVIEQLMLGKSNPQIADELCISRAAVKYHMTRLSASFGIDIELYRGQQIRRQVLARIWDEVQAFDRISTRLAGLVRGAANE